MEIEQLLQDEIKDELQGLSTLELGSDKYKVTTDGIVKLMDKAIEMDKINRDQDERQANRNEDLELKYRQIEAEIRDRKVKNVITVVVSGVGTVVTIWGTLKTLKFEEVALRKLGVFILLIRYTNNLQCGKIENRLLFRKRRVHL